MKLIKSIQIYNPQNLGVKDVLIAGGKIMAVSDNIEIESNLDIEVIEGGDGILIPGIIDQHMHITGGGGEGGFTTRVPEAQLSSFIKGGITTGVGLLGTDASTRSMENLIAKAHALTEEGVTVYALTGSYELPSPTLTGSCKKDIVFVDPIIGTKIAANDHRDSAVQPVELARIAADARTAGMISGKSGHVVVHMGDGRFKMGQIREAIELSNIPINILRPTHVNRDEALFQEALEFAKDGGYIDITCGIDFAMSNLEVMKRIDESGVDYKNVTFTSDGFGSWSNYDEDGNLIEMGYIEIDAMLRTFQSFVREGLDIEKILPLFTSNQADQLKLKNKGYIEEDRDADLLILDQNYDLQAVMSKGEWLMKDGDIVKYGTYE